MASRREVTRRRILDAAWARLAAGDPARLEDVAADAGVSRQAVYLHFGSRAGLLLALVDLIDAELGLFPKLEAIRALPSPVEQLHASVRLTAELAPRVHPVAIALSRLSATDPDAREAYDSRMDMRREGLLGLVRAVEAQGGLAEGWTPDEVADALWTAGAPAVWQQLGIERGWTPERFAAWLEHLARSFTPG
jgi:AcrR family transcriptional regulator